MAPDRVGTHPANAAQWVRGTEQQQLILFPALLLLLLLLLLTNSWPWPKGDHKLLLLTSSLDQAISDSCSSYAERRKKEAWWCCFCSWKTTVHVSTNCRNHRTAAVNPWKAKINRKVSLNPASRMHKTKINSVSWRFLLKSDSCAEAHLSSTFILTLS